MCSMTTRLFPNCGCEEDGFMQEGVCDVARPRGHSRVFTRVITRSNWVPESIISQCNLCCDVEGPGAAGKMTSNKQRKTFLGAYCALNSEVRQ